MGEIRTSLTEFCNFTPRQEEACRVIANGKRYILYGGAVGGGKSYWLRKMLIRWLIEAYRAFGIKGIQVMLACETIPALKDRQVVRFETEMPAWLGTLKDEDKTYGRCFKLNDLYGGGVICLRNLDDPSKYNSAEFAVIAVDELTKNKVEVFNFLRQRLRYPPIPDEHCLFLAATNPGGIGHGWVKQLWIDQKFPIEYREPKDLTQLFAYIPSKATDNPYIDPGYYDTLQTLPPGLREAYRDGNWDVFVGQAFPEFGIDHQVEPYTMPDYYQRFMTFDWGYGKPFSIGWWRVDDSGRLIRVHEWYGWNGNADQGLRLMDGEIATGILKTEEEIGFKGKDIIRLAGRDCFDKKPDYRGGGQSPTTAEIFALHGIYLIPGDPNRLNKMRNFRTYLSTYKDGRPMLQVFRGCDQTMRTIPNIMMSKTHHEDIDTSNEDHVYDEIGLICNYRTTASIEMHVKPQGDLQKHLSRLLKQESEEDTYTDVM